MPTSPSFMIDPIYQISSYDYHLPESQIAQEPTIRRDGSRLLIVHKKAVTIEDRNFAELPSLIQPGDVLVVNDTKVFPARLLGKKDTGGQVELLLLHYPDPSGHPLSVQTTGSQAEVKGLVKSSKRPKPGSLLFFGSYLTAEVLEVMDNGEVRALLHWEGDLDQVLNACGVLPLPPYIHRPSTDAQDDGQRYQTIYAKETGAIAAPTAGLHFSDELFGQIKEKGGKVAAVTLHVGYGTFAPVRVTDIRDHSIHAEYVTVPKATVDAIREAKNSGGRIWAVGTTAARALEFAAKSGELQAVSDWCRLYIYPGYQFRVIDNLITNFHLPKSSLLFMVSAFAGFNSVKKAYQQALDLHYRFYSYGDAMVLFRE
jgi:S-adenosylmethionine:tRNA ribosyltransferase-isomerase